MLRAAACPVHPLLIGQRAFHLAKRDQSAIKKLLIANRGEIACRVMRTAKRMGIKTVAVFSDIDANAQHVQMADEAVHIGGNAPGDSYLRADKLIDVLKETGADAVHPGYGFLSESSTFSQAVKDAGAAFVGPGPRAIDLMGDKIMSMRLAQEAGVDCAPRHDGEVNSADEALQIAGKLGYPVILKASAGGGGKGMRIALNESELVEGYESARKEAMSSFGDDRMLVQHYVCPNGGRHIEIQVIGDSHGNYLYLNERECSVQRRHQKVVEEAPSVLISPDMRQKMGEQAVSLCRAVGYESAGTVEFLVDPESKKWYFLEMNTRLQVEHPVTEFITGVDLVEMMINVAAGEKLTMTQKDVKTDGWAIEARVYAEDPYNEFRPGSGPLKYLRTPLPDDPKVRVDSGVVQGDDVSVFYDPMIAKLIVHGPNRNAAIAKMGSALQQYNIVGLPTNIQYCADIVSHPDFVSGEFDTSFIKVNEESLLNPASPLTADLVQAAVAIVLRDQMQAAATQSASGDPYSPWGSLSGVMAGTGLTRTIALRSGSDDVLHTLSVSQEVGAASGTYVVQGKGWEAVATRVQMNGDDRFSSIIDGRAHTSRVVQLDNGVHVFTGEAEHHFETPAPAFVTAFDSALGADVVLAPMNGAVQEVYVAPGDIVTKGQAVAVMFAMKMETVLKAPRDGVVASVSVEVGSQVNLDAFIITLEKLEDKE